MSSQWSRLHNFFIAICSCSKVRDWVGMMPGAVGLKNAYRNRGKKAVDDKVVPHSFTFMARHSLPRHGAGLQLSERVPLRLQQDDRDNDIFALTKVHISDDNLSQDPLMVHPASLVHETEHYWNRVNSTRLIARAVLEDERAKEIEELARHIEMDFPSLHRSVAFYRKMLNPDGLTPYPEIKFLKCPRANQRWCQVNLGERPPAPKAHHLQVVFRRG